MGCRTNNEVIIHALAGPGRRRERALGERSPYVFTFPIVNPGAGFHGGAIKRGRETICPGGSRREKKKPDAQLRNDRIFLQGGGNLMLFGRRLQCGDRGKQRKWD